MERLKLLYDGSLEGFFTAVFTANRDGKHFGSASINTKKKYKPDLFEEVIEIPTRQDEALRVLDGIVRKMNKTGLNTITRAFLSEAEECEDVIHRFIRKGMRFGSGFIENMTDPDAVKVMEMSRKTMREYHRFLGLLRFKTLSTGEYYAPFKPDTNLLPLLGRHFASRFPDQAWMIHDKRRDTALVHIDGKVEIINFEVNLESIKEIESAAGEDPWKELWKIYHKKIGIEERINPGLQMNFMPKKHWEYLPEMEED
ncbi:MAG: TIGR03915 family putative DNA repair protein [Spirochaetales bacterium]|nr:TIGR03915 family putative DNA repair protein [Spirochaetales bacterium]